jgi:hypothetical protein
VEGWREKVPLWLEACLDMVGGRLPDPNLDSIPDHTNTGYSCVTVVLHKIVFYRLCTAEICVP